MYDEDMEEQQKQFCFDIIMMDEDNMVSSYVMEEKQIKFPNLDLVVNQNGMKKLSDQNVEYDKIKIQPKKMKELQLLGKGSAGIVKRAVYQLNGKEYIFAIKSINAAEDEGRKQLLNDLRSYMNASSQYLIQFYTCFFRDGLVKQVIEYMDMGSLKGLINLVTKKKIVITQEELAVIIYKILNGLLYIHDIRHSLHRDIKPQNILLNSKGQVKITDFGVSKCIQNSLGKSSVGTYIYMSPQRLTKGLTYSYKCDIWSVGLILYQLATGKPLPYVQEKSNFFKVGQKVIHLEPPQIPIAEYSPELVDFVKRCLQKDAEARASVIVLLNHPWIVSKANKGNLLNLIERIQTVK